MVAGPFLILLILLILLLIFFLILILIVILILFAKSFSCTLATLARGKPLYRLAEFATSPSHGANLDDRAGLANCANSIDRVIWPDSAKGDD